MEENEVIAPEVEVTEEAPEMEATEETTEAE